MRLLLIICCNIISLYSVAQDYVIRNFNIEDGLPSSEVHAIYEDAKGFMWFATDRGLVRYNGEDFQVYNESDGLSNMVLFNIYEERPDRIWIADLDNQLYCYNPFVFPLKFEPFKFNNVLVESFGKAHGFSQHIRRFWMDDLGNYYFSFLIFPGAIKIDQKGGWSLLNYRPELNNEGEFRISKLKPIYLDFNNEHPERIYNNYRYLSESEDRGVTISYDNDTFYLEKEEIYNIRPQFGVADVQVRGDSTYFLVGKNLFIHSKGQLDRLTLNSNGLRVKWYEDKIWVATYTGVEIFNLEHKKGDVLLEGYRITDLYRDDSGGYWFSSAQNGIFYLVNDKVKAINVEKFGSKVVNNIELNDDLLVCNTWNKGLFIFKERFGKPQYYSNVAFQAYMHVWNEASALFQINASVPSNPLLIERGMSPSLQWKDGVTVYHQKSSIHHWTDSTYKTYYPRVPSIFSSINRGDSIIIATARGLYAYNIGGESRKISFEHPAQNARISKVREFKNGLLMATYGFGIVYLSDEEVYSLNKKDGLSSSDILDFCIESDSVVWVGSYGGVDRIQLNSNQRRPFQIGHYNKSTGMSSEQVMSLTSYNDTLWIGTKLGINLIPTKDRSYEGVLNKNNFVVDSIRLNNHKVYAQSEGLQMNEGDVLDVYFTQLSYSSNGTVKYEYRLLEEGVSWQNANSRGLRISGLKDGKYTLQIRPYLNGEKSEIHDIQLRVLAPWWKSWWAITMYALVFIGLLFLIFRILLNITNKRRQKELEKVQLELKALVSQMNPHFTFNTINSIQHYIVQNESRKALDYLAEFALLIRRALDFSRREFITLAEEIEFLSLYVDLESRRFGYEIEFKTDIDTKRSPEIIAFPALMLQPIVENAIVHGLHGIDWQGVVTLGIKEKDKYFDIEISDNGRGINKDQESDPNRKSHGLDILKSRIGLYNASRGKQTDIEVISSEGKGTTVKIRLYKKMS